MFRRLKPPAVYVTAECDADERCARRVERMLASIDTPTVVRGVTDAQLAELVESQGWRDGRRWGERPGAGDPPIVLNTLKLGHSEEERRRRLERYPALGAHRLHGYFGFDYRRDGVPEWRREQGRVCQPAYEFHTICGCPFRCAYCGQGVLINIALNIEEFLEFADARIRALQPPQTIYKWDNITDINAFEPEYDATRVMVDHFARQTRDFLLLYTGKSDNVDFLLDYDHRGQTIIQWSISGRSQSTLIEPETAPWDKRIEAAAKCERAGYPVRFRFSPIIPVRGWREENRELIELMLARTHPDVVSLCMFGWMDFAAARACLDLSLLEDKFVAAMEGTAPFLKGKAYGPLPHEARLEIYDFLISEIHRVSPSTPIALCLETPAMWAHFRDRLGQDDAHYVCVCGPYCGPR